MIYLAYCEKVLIFYSHSKNADSLTFAGLSNGNLVWWVAIKMRKNGSPIVVVSAPGDSGKRRQGNEHRLDNGPYSYFLSSPVVNGAFSIGA